MLLAAARALAGTVGDDELNPAYIVPSVFNPDVSKVVAAAVAEVARNERERTERDRERLEREREAERDNATVEDVPTA